jgi:fibronectin-binding autotransporter adhesin
MNYPTGFFSCVKVALVACLLYPGLGLQAQTSVYWDINNTTAGAGGATPGGAGFEWNSTHAFWNTAATGSGGTLAAWSAGNIAVFSAGSDATGTYTIGVQGSHDVRGLSFEEGTVTLQGGTLNFTADSFLTVADSLVATLDGLTLSGSSNLTLRGKGTLRFTGASTGSLTGDFRIDGGLLELSSTSGPALGTGDILIESSSGAAANLNPSTLRLLASNQIADTAHVTVVSRQYRAGLFDLNGFNETIGGLTIASSTGTVGIGVRTGSGAVLTVLGDIFLHNDRAGTGNNARDVLITGTGSRTSLAPDSGILDLGGGVRTITVEGRAPTLFEDSDAAIETTIRNGGIIKAGPQMLILTGTNIYTGGTTISAGTLRIGSGSTTGSIMGDVVNNSVIEFNRSNAYTFSGNITGTGTLNKLGTGALKLTGTNAYGGVTSVLNGTLQIEKIGMAGSVTDSNVGTNTYMDLGSGTVNVGLEYQGTGETTDKILRLTGSTGNVTLTASGTGALVFQNALNFTTAGNKTLTLTGSSMAANTLPGISNSPGEGTTQVVKTGAGTWVISSNSSYTGITTINNGTLRLTATGSISQSGLRLPNGVFEIAGADDVTLVGDPSMVLNAGELINYSVILGGGPVGSSSTINIASNRTLNLQSNLAFLATNNNQMANITGGTLNIGNERRVFVVGNSSSADPDLTISSVITGGDNSVLMKAGLGRLTLTQGLNLNEVHVNVGRLDLGGLENTLGSLLVGVNNAGALHYSVPGGSLSVGSGASDTLQIGITRDLQQYSYGASFSGVIDLRGSANFTANVGQLFVGVHTSNGFGYPSFVTITAPALDGVTTPVSMTPINNAFYMATNNTITAASNFVVADAASSSVSGTNTVQFGEGLNLINTPNLYIGYRKGSGAATIRAGGRLEVKGIGEAGRTALYIGHSAVNTGGATTNSLDLTGGTFIGSLSSISIGFKSGGSGATAGSAIGTLTLTGAENQVNVSGNVVIGHIAGIQASATSFGRGTLNMGGGTFTVSGNVDMSTIAATGTGATNANLTSSGMLNLTGGTFTVGGNINRGQDSLNRTSATITVDGGILDVTAGNIGSAAAPIILNARSGGLRGINEFNGGAPLIKTTSGLMTLGGVNNYTGGTQIQGGTLEVLMNSRTGVGNTTIQGADAVLAGNGTISGNALLTQGSIRPGANGGVGNGMLTFAGDLTLNATTGTLRLGIAGPTGIADLSTHAVADIPSAYDFTSYNSETHNLGNHDLIRVQGALTWNSGTKLVVEDTGVFYSYGQVFNLLDWSGLMNGGPTLSSTTSFGGAVNSYLELPSLVGTGFHWDLSLFTSHGVLVVVPEPGRALLLFFGGMALMARRRRTGLPH